MNARSARHHRPRGYGRRAAAGLVTMARGGEWNRKYGNLLMRARIGAQALAVALMFVLFLIKSGWTQ